MRRPLRILIRIGVIPLVLLISVAGEFWLRPNGIVSYFVVSCQFSKIRTGDSREHVEGLFGQPFVSTTTTIDSIPPHVKEHITPVTRAVFYSYRQSFDIVVIYDERNRVVYAWDLYE